MAESKNVSVRRSEALNEALEVFEKVPGLKQSDAVTWAVGQAARALLAAWGKGIVPVGRLPRITGFVYDTEDTDA